MKLLTTDEAIAQALAKFPTARKIAVENVAHWPSGDLYANRVNLAADTRCYAWKGDTLKAINFVLKKQGKI